MISRHWSGVARPDRVADYVEHLRTETFPGLRKLPGFMGASILRRAVPGGVEVLVITEWQSLEAVRAFAGREVDVAVVPGVVQQMMVDYDRVVRHYEIVS